MILFERGKKINGTGLTIAVDEQAKESENGFGCKSMMFQSKKKKEKKAKYWTDRKAGIFFSPEMDPMGPETHEGGS